MVGLGFKEVGVAAALDLDGTGFSSQRGHVGIGDRDVRRRGVLGETVRLGCAVDGHDPLLLREQPGQSDLTGCGRFGLGDLLDLFDEGEVLARASGAKRRIWARRSDPCSNITNEGLIDRGVELPLAGQSTTTPKRGPKSAWPSRSRSSVPT